MSYSDTSGSTDQSSTSMTRDVGSFLMPRDPSITNPWMRPRPAQGKQLCDLFQDDVSYDNSNVEDQHLKVFLRVKPMNRSFKEEPYEIGLKRIVTFQEETKSNKKSVQFKKSYSFSHIFHNENNTQPDIYKYIIKENFAKFIDGQDYTIMTYGSSGSGKTYSLMGTEDEPGIVPRCLESLFKAIKVDRLPRFKPKDNSYAELNSVNREDEVRVTQSIFKLYPNQGVAVESLDDSLASYRRQSLFLQPELQSQFQHLNHKVKYEVWVSFIEIYNESIHDLLREKSSIPNQPLVPLRLFHANNSKPYIKGVRWVYVRSGEEAYAALERGRRLLKFARTNVNSHSSRSHCIFSVRLMQYTDARYVTMSTFRLCDLAGSERAKRTGNEGLRMNESKSINSSLHVLEKCLTIQRSQSGLPPFRESKLTSLLQNALCGNEAIGMLVTINPDPKYFDETQHTLQLSAIAKDIRIIDPCLDTFHKSKSCIDLSDRISSFSTDMTYEITYLKEELEKIKGEQEQYAQMREMEVRKEIMNKVKLMKKEANIDFEERLEQEKEQLATLHQFEIKRLERSYEQLIRELRDEIDALKRTINDLKNKESIKCFEVQSCNETNKDDTLNCDDRVVNLNIVKVEKEDIKEEMLESSLNRSNTVDISNCDLELTQNKIDSIADRNSLRTSLNNAHSIDRKELLESTLIGTESIDDGKSLNETNSTNKKELSESTLNKTESFADIKSLNKTNSTDETELSESTLNKTVCIDDGKSLDKSLNKTNSTDKTELSESTLNKTESIDDGKSLEKSLDKTNSTDKKKLSESTLIKTESIDDRNLIDKKELKESTLNITDSVANGLLLEASLSKTNPIDGHHLETSLNLFSSDFVVKNCIENEISNGVNKTLELSGVASNERKSVNDEESIVKELSSDIWEDASDSTEIFTSNDNSNVIDKKSLCTSIISKSILDESEIELCIRHISKLNMEVIEKTFEKQGVSNEQNKSEERSDCNTESDLLRVDLNSSFIDAPKNESENMYSIASSEMSDDDYIRMSENSDGSHSEIVNSEMKSVESACFSTKVTKIVKSSSEDEPKKRSKLKLKRKTHCVIEAVSVEEDKAVSCKNAVDLLPVVKLEDFITPMKKVVTSESGDYKENCSLNKFDTEKKEKATELYSFKKGAMTAGSSRRKLFTKRENNEKAAETKEPIRSHRHLNFDEDSPGPVQAPEVIKPYAFEKKKHEAYEKKAIRSPYSLRKKK